MANLDGAFRRQLALPPGVGFAATTEHICNGIRKLAAVATPDEVSRTLWRGLRGELPRSFWLHDNSGMAVAVDQGFMSCSRSRTIPLEFMSDGDEGKNVLVHLRPETVESDSALHCGADIGMLSQFRHEEEVRLPVTYRYMLSHSVTHCHARRRRVAASADPDSRCQPNLNPNARRRGGGGASNASSLDGFSILKSNACNARNGFSSLPAPDCCPRLVALLRWSYAYPR